MLDPVPMVSIKIYFNFRVAMVSSPEVRQGALPPGFLVEREVEPVGRFIFTLLQHHEINFDIFSLSCAPVVILILSLDGSFTNGRGSTLIGQSAQWKSRVRKKKTQRMRWSLRMIWIISGQGFRI